MDKNIYDSPVVDSIYNNREGFILTKLLGNYVK